MNPSEAVNPTPPSGVNEFFQRIAEQTHDVVTPANAMSLAGFTLAVAGAAKMDSLPGVMTMGAGRVLDILDGKVARATGTASDLGEMVDATLDKTAVGIMCIQALRRNIVPKAVLGSIAAQNVANTLLTLYDRRKHPEDPHIHPSKEGKHTMFAQNASIGFFCLAEAAKPPAIRQSLRAAGWISAAVAAVKGARATKGYYLQATSD